MRDTLASMLKFLDLKVSNLGSKKINGLDCSGLGISCKYFTMQYFFTSTIKLPPSNMYQWMGAYGELSKKKNQEYMDLVAEFISPEFAKTLQESTAVRIEMQIPDLEKVDRDMEKRFGSKPKADLKKVPSTFSLVLDMNYEAKPQLAPQLYNFDDFTITAISNDMVDEFITSMAQRGTRHYEEEPIDINDTGDDKPLDYLPSNGLKPMKIGEPAPHIGGKPRRKSR